MFNGIVHQKLCRVYLRSCYFETICCCKLWNLKSMMGFGFFILETLNVTLKLWVIFNQVLGQKENPITTQGLYFHLCWVVLLGQI